MRDAASRRIGALIAGLPRAAGVCGPLCALLAGRTVGAQRPVSSAPRTASGSCSAAPAEQVADDWPDVAHRLAGVAGRRIDSIRVVTHAPAWAHAGHSAPLHVTTHAATVRERLLFAVGDPLDPLRVAESMRQLRRLRFIAGATVDAACSPSGGVTLTVATRDAWSLKPRLRMGSAGEATAGIEESNLLGTGRGARLYARSDRGQLGIGAAYTDPALAGAPVTATISRDVFRDGSAWAALVSTPNAGAFERWGVGLAIAQSARASVLRERAPAASLPGDSVRRLAAGLLVSRRLGDGAGSATFALAGLEAERTAVVAGARTAVLGPVDVRRSFVGVDVGVARRARRYQVVPWLLPTWRASSRDTTRAARENPPELPIGTEVDALVGIGRDLVPGAPAAHVDAWAGRVWRAGSAADGVPRALLSAGAWVGGFRPLGAARSGAPDAASGTAEWSDGVARLAVGAVAPGRRGLWSLQATAERLADPDPDTRGLAAIDPALRAIPGRSRLAEAALAVTVDRTVHLRPITHSYVLDAVLFGRASLRRDPATRLSPQSRLEALAGADPERLTSTAADGTPSEPLGSRVAATSVGVGLQLTPARFGRSSIRLDLGIPVVASGGVPVHRPFVGLTIIPAMGAVRGRDGGRLPTP